MGFRRIGFVWFFSSLSAVVFFVLAVSLSVDTANTAPGEAMQRTVPPAAAPPVQHAIDRPEPSLPQAPSPILETRAGNVDRRGVMVPVTRAGALLSADADLILP